MNLNIFRLLLIAFCLLSFNLVNAQDEDSKPIRTEKSKSKTIIVDGYDEEVDSESSTSVSADPQNLVKLNLSPILTGSYSLSYARAFSDFFNLELTLGLNKPSEFYREIYNPVFIGNLDTPESNTFIPLANALSNSIQYKPGIIYRIQARFNSGDYNFEGSYYAIEFNQRTFSYDFRYSSFNSGGLFDERQAGNHRHSMTEYKVLWGFQNSIGDSNFFFDVNLGVGLSLYRTTFEYYLTDTNGIPTGDVKTAKSGREFNGNYSLGVAIGYAF
jgi:hypothetical protein